jgi:hypothetical protein
MNNNKKEIMRPNLEDFMITNDYTPYDSSYCEDNTHSS